eukprot:c19866_g2_i1 orf=611-2659(+)
MDFSQCSVAISVGLPTRPLSFGERSLSNLDPELGEVRPRTSVQPISPGASDVLFPNHAPKQCRSTSDIDIGSADDQKGRMKFARTDSFTGHPESKLQMTSSGSLRSLVRGNSMISEGRLGCSTRNLTTDVGALLASETNAVSEESVLRNDSNLAFFQNTARTPRSMPYHNQTSSFRASGLSLPIGRDAVSLMGVHEINDPCPVTAFTMHQYRELRHQTLIFKYISYGLNVPADLLTPIRNSVLGSSGIAAAPHQFTNIGWGNYHLGFTNNTDPEPGRCRRTDGKKWRCSKEVVPDQKYCERHMHRGKHRTRKPMESQAIPSSQSMAVVVASSGATSASLTAPGGMNPSCTRSSILLSTEQSKPSNLGSMSYSGTNLSSGVPIASAINCGQLQLPVLPSASGPAVLPVKDYRFLNGVTTSEIDIGPEQMFLSEGLGSSRGFAQASQSMNELPMFSSVNSSWRSSILSKQQNAFLGSGLGVEAVSVGGRETEGQPLRHFFDDWPRSRDPVALSWSDVEDSRGNSTSSTAQLSISIPLTSSDFAASNSSSPRGKLSFSPLKLSISKAEDEEPIDVDPTQMALGVGMGLAMNGSQHRHTNWIPISWETSVGGPLAEVLQSSTPRGCKSSGLNLLTDGWENSPQCSPMGSPAGASQNATFGSFSDRGGAGGVPDSGVGSDEISNAMD